MAQSNVQAAATTSGNAESSATVDFRVSEPRRGLLGSKTQDPLIRAEAEKKLREQRAYYQQEFQQSIEDMEKQFQLHKSELMLQNEREIEAEREKWERYKRE